MTIQAFTKEIEDGLQAQLSNNTIAFNCSLSKSEVPTDVTLKSVAAFKDGRNFDLYYLQAILASVGPNKNDDWFLPEEVWAARETPVHKQLNYMHNEKDIIGVITDSILLDAQGNTIFTDALIPNIKDIATQAVIWTHWDDKSVENRISKIIASIEDNKYFVSMEALFQKFDYMLVSNGNFTLVPRNEATAFLTKHLRAYGGSGEFEGARLYRVLRDFTFSGKGIVDDPANPRSVIDDSLFNSIASCDCECCDCPEEEVELEDYEEVDEDFSAIASEQKDKKVKLNKPFRTPKGPKKFSVYVKNDKGNIVKVNFGDPNMEIKRDDPKRREAFRSRHNCDNPGPKWKAKYWSCKFWSTQNVNKIVSKTSENIMEKEVAELQAQLAKANQLITELKASQVDKASAEVQTLSNQVAALKALAEESKTKMDETEKECAEKMDKMEKDCAEKMDKMEKDCASKVEELEASVASLKAEKVMAERKSKLIAANVTEDKIENVLKTFASASDEMFNEITNLYSNVSKSQATTETTVTSVTEAVESAQASNQVTNPIEKVEASTTNEDRLQLLQKSLAEKFNFKNKGDK